MKMNSILVLVLLIAITGVGWVMLFQNQSNNTKAYTEYIAEADRSAKKGIYVDAIDFYQKALNVNPQSFDIEMKIADMYQKLDDSNGLIESCDKAIAIDNSKSEPYLTKINYYISKSKYSDALAVVDAANNVKDKSKLEEVKKSLHNKYIEKYVSFQKVSDWHVGENSDYAAFCEDDKWGMTGKDGSKKITPDYDYIGAYSEEEAVTPCCLNGEYYYIDKDGHKKLVGDKSYQYLGSFGCGYAPAQLNNIYGYIDKNFKESNFEYQYAGAFSNGVAAVKKDSKWELINTKFQKVSASDFDDIKVDDYGYCSMFGLVVAKQNGKYYLFDTSGKKLFDAGYDDMKLPASSDEPIAIKNNDKWGFVNKSGQVVIKPQYADANSFSLNLAPVKENERWGFVDLSNKMAIEAKFFDAKPFSQNGSAPVKNSACWDFIVLCEYDK